MAENSPGPIGPGSAESDARLGNPSVVARMRQIIGMYYDGLQNEDRYNFKQLRPSLKTDKVCWEWAEHPETYDRSVELKALQMVYGLTKAIYQGETRQIKVRHVPTCDPYWAQVDEKMAQIIESVATEEVGEFYGVPDLEALSREEEYHHLATIRDFYVYKRGLVRGGQLIHAEYLTAHSLETL